MAWQRGDPGEDHAGSDAMGSSSVLYSSFDYDGLLEEFKGCERLTSLYGDREPKLRNMQSFGGGGTSCIGSSRPVEFRDDNLYAYCRSYQKSASLVQVCAARNEPIISSEGCKELTSGHHSEVSLPHGVADLTKLDSRHIAACFDSNVAILAFSEGPNGFFDVSSTTIWQDDVPLQLTESRPQDGTLLVAASCSLRSLQLEDTTAQAVWSGSCNGAVTSIAWNHGPSDPPLRAVASCTDISGNFSMFDTRAPVHQLAATCNVLPRGLFAHASVGGNAFACAGRGGVVHTLDCRQLGKGSVQRIADPFLEHISEISACKETRNFMAYGSGGFTLWKLGSGMRPTCLEMHHGPDFMRGMMLGPDRAVATDKKGCFQEWAILQETNHRGRGSKKQMQKPDSKYSSDVSTASSLQSSNPPPQYAPQLPPSAQQPWQSVALQSNLQIQEVQDWDMFEDLTNLAKEDSINDSKFMAADVAESSSSTVALEQNATTAISGADIESGVGSDVSAGGDLDELIGLYFS